MSTAASSSQQQSSLSRLARLTANLGLKQLSHTGPSRQPRRYTDANESEWYIPYNGPIEQPKQVAMGKARERDSWTDTVAGGERVHDHFERDVSSVGYGGASTSGHGHGYAYGGSSGNGHTVSSHWDEDRERGRQMSPASKYSESPVSPAGGERRSRVVASATTSPISPRRRPLPLFVDLDSAGVGIGESPVPTQRFGHSSNSGHGHDPQERAQMYAWPSSAPAPAAPGRDSTSSFWTFGRTGSKKNPSINVVGGRPSAESRPSTSTRQTGSQVPVVMRDRSATITGQPSNPQSMRPRANTAVVPAAAPAISKSQSASDQPVFNRQYFDDRPDADHSDTHSYQRHPYATAVSPTGHRLHSQISPSAEAKQDPAQRRSPGLGLNVPFLSTSKSFASLRNTARNLKSSVSTPNLRGERPRKGNASGGSSVNSPGAQSSSSTGTKWLSPETWCDALLFPRPRFRMRSHAISPPMSPVGGNPPYSAPAQTQSQPRTLKKSLPGGRGPQDLPKESDAPSSAPPAVVYPGPDPDPPPPAPAPKKPETVPAQKTLRPPRPKSFAQDDLAIPSPVPSLATVLKQNDEFEKERNEWKTQAARSFGNKRSRSLSRSRMRARARVAGKPPESEGELAFSFDLIATTAFHGSQNLKPSIHFAPSTTASGARSRLGTNTTSTGLNTTSTHSRNTSNASKGGSAPSRSNDHGHTRKESWSKSAIRTAKQTAHVTGLCADTDDLSPAEEKVLALDRKLQQDRTKHVDANGHGRTDEGGDGVLVISAQTSQYLSAPQPNMGGPSLSPVPSDRSGESTGQSGVGIALSTPTALVDQPFQFTDHPYATGPDQKIDMPRPAEYAGPHPSRMADFSLNESTLSDVSARHRKPASTPRTLSGSTSPHPYATAEPRSRPTLRVPTSNIPPPARMFADVGTGSIREVLPEDIQYSPYSAQHSANSKHNSEALGVEEALSLAFSRGHADNGNTEGQPERDVGEVGDFGSGTGAQELIAPAILKPASDYRRGRMPLIEEGSVRESWQHSHDDGVAGNLMVPTPMSTISFRAKTSPGQTSLDSSPMTSPRQFKQFDDMEDYSDLFYRPGHPSNASGGTNPNNSNSGSSGEPTPPEEPDRILTFGDEEAGGSRRPMLARSNSALTNLRRKLNEEYGAGLESRHVHREDTGSRRHVSDVIEVDEGIDDTHAFLAHGSPPGASLPLRLQTTRAESPGPEGAIPEDVESSRASSILERYETEEGTDIYYRVGEVPALATPNPVTSANAHRASAHGSYVDHTPQSNPRSLSPDDRGRIDHSARPSLLQPLSANSTTRGSYMTSTSGTSHISQLSEFPVPPGHPSLTPGTIIQSYFGNSPEPSERRELPEESAELPERKRQERRSRRTTFGPVSDDES